MAIIKCKMCGGDLELIEGQSVATCEYCGTAQTVPRADNEKKLTLFARANRLRRANEFDKAAGIYEAIVAEFPEEAEAYWGLVLCKYGIEYVDDPATAKKVPTCHRSSFDSILEDSDFEQALENADVVAQRTYRDEAKQIEDIRRGIIAVSSKEDPYDIFICYKERDEFGSRTLDSVLAQDIYEELTDRGYRAFFARITLEAMPGIEYEPYIFAALNSAKLMLVIGTDYEYFNAVWVKNEWARFLKLMAADKTRHLIPCFKGMNTDDLPSEFAKLQAQDLGKVGIMQDLMRGIEKLLPKKTASQAVSQTVAVTDQFGIEDLLRKIRIHLEEKNWGNVQSTCNRITAIDPENPWAYIYQLARVMRVTDPEKLSESVEILSKSSYYEKALKYADPALSAKLQAWCRGSEEACRLAEARCEKGRLNARKVYGLLAGGKEHTAAVLTDGTVVALGSNEKGQCDVSLWRDIVAVACGGEHTVGLRGDGTVVACGDNEYGQCDVEAWKDIVAVACDDEHTVGLCSDGTVVSCGSERFGRREISQWRDIRAIACGYSYTLGLKTDGTVVAVGGNSYGQCKVNGWTDVVALSCNNAQTVGLQKNGIVVACGCTDDNRIATRMWRDVVAVGMGTHHTVGLKTDGTIITCGDDGQGRCSGTKQWNGIVGIARGYWHTLAIRADGTVLACGDADNGKCKVDGLKLFNSIDTLEEEREAARAKRKAQDEATEQIRNRAIKRRDASEVLLAGGQNHVAMVGITGALHSRGSNEKNQRMVDDWRNVVAVACGEFHTVALLRDGSVLACGSNENGQCNVSGWRNIKAVACGYRHTVGLRSDGTVVACGENSLDECNVGQWSDVVSVSCGYYHTVGLRSDGTVLVTGHNRYGQCEAKNWKDMINIAACNVHTVGVKKDGTVLACGDNENGECNVGDWTDIVSVACGSHHTLGLRLDGTVVACGNDGDGRCTETKQWKDIVGIACGMWYSMGIHPNGKIDVCGEFAEKIKLKFFRLFDNVDTLEQEQEKMVYNQKAMPVIARNLGSILSVKACVTVSDDGKVLHRPNSVGNDFLECEKWEDIVAVDGNYDFAVGLRKNGTVVYTGAPCFGSKGEVECWEDIIQICCGSSHTVGLRQDGTVVACGRNREGQCNVSDWKNIIRIRCGDECTIGLCADGTVVACGDNRFGQCNVASWRDIISIECAVCHTVGLRRNGTVVACGSNDYGVCNVSAWKNIVQIATSMDHVVGIRADGKAEASGNNESKQSHVSVLGDRVSVACGTGCTFALRCDGIVSVCGKNKYGAESFQGMEDIMAIKAEGFNVFALRSDGVLVYTTEKTGGKQQHWKVYESARSLETERKVSIPTDPAEKKRIHDEILMKYEKRRRAGLCQRCGGELKGLLGKKCAVCGAKKDY